MLFRSISDNKDLKKLSSSNRNYRQNESKFNKFFKDKVNESKRSGNYKKDSDNYSGSGETIHTSSYNEKPKEITPIKNYGSHPYNLEFQQHKNIEKTKNNEYKYDTTYYAIQWKPTNDYDELFIEKSKYDKSGNSKKEIISPIVKSTDKNKVKNLIYHFKSLHESKQQLHNR